MQTPRNNAHSYTPPRSYSPKSQKHEVHILASEGYTGKRYARMWRDEDGFLVLAGRYVTAQLDGDTAILSTLPSRLAQWTVTISLKDLARIGA